MTNSKDLAPIALFVYNRPEHTRLTIEALTRNPEASDSCLFVFSDGAKSRAQQDAVNTVRNYLSQIHGFSEVNIIERDTNWGLANSIIDGVTELSRQYGKVIVLEDDLQTSPHFLAYMNGALKRFQDDERVASISGYMFPIEHDFGNKIFFRDTPLSWGWATWERAWSGFNPDGKKLLQKLKKERKLTKFNHAGPQPYSKMLKRQISGKNNSWFVRWSAYLFLNGKLTLMPTHSLVKNIGIDGSGTHCAEWRFNPYHVELIDSPIEIELLDGRQSSKIEKRLKSYFTKVRFFRYVNFIYRLMR